KRNQKTFLCGPGAFAPLAGQPAGGRGVSLSRGLRQVAEEKEPKDFFLWTGSVCPSGRATSRRTGCIFITRPPAKQEKKPTETANPHPFLDGGCFVGFRTHNASTY